MSIWWCGFLSLVKQYPGYYQPAGTILRISGNSRNENSIFLSAFIRWESLHYFEWKWWILYYNIHKIKIMSQLIFGCLQKLQRKNSINQRSSNKIDSSTWYWKIILLIKYEYWAAHIFVKIVIIFCYKVWAFFKK